MQTNEKEPKTKVETKKPIEKPLPVWPTGLIISDDQKVGVSVARDLAVLLTRQAFEQLFGWAYATNREISCLGSVSRTDNLFVINELFLLKQSGSFASTEIDQDAIAQLMEKLMAEGKAEHLHSLKCWAHSHPGMGVFWSGTDDQTCRLMVNDYLVSLVVSDSFKIRCRIDIAGPIPLVIDQVPVLYEMQQDQQNRELYSEQVKAAVSDKFTFFEEDDTVSHKPSETNNIGDTTMEQITADYCGFCGTFHGLGQCPLDDEGLPSRLLQYYEF